MQYVPALRPQASRAPSRMTSLREERVLRNRGGRDDGLRAVAAVLRADAALRVHEHVQLHLAPEVTRAGRGTRPRAATAARRRRSRRTASASSRVGRARRAAPWSASSSKRPVAAVAATSSTRCLLSSERSDSSGSRSRWLGDVLGERGAGRLLEPGHAAETATPPKRSISSGFVSALGRCRRVGR